MFQESPSHGCVPVVKVDLSPDDERELRLGGLSATLTPSLPEGQVDELGKCDEMQCSVRPQMNSTSGTLSSGTQFPGFTATDHN